MLFRIILSYFYSFTRCCFLSNTGISPLLPTSEIPPTNTVHQVVAPSVGGRSASLLPTFSDLAETDFDNTVSKYCCSGYVSSHRAEQFMKMQPAHPLSFQGVILQLKNNTANNNNKLIQLYTELFPKHLLKTVQRETLVFSAYFQR